MEEKMEEIRYYMEEPLLSINADTSAAEAAKFMLENRVGGLLVVENEEYVGIITDVDFTRKVVAKELSPRETKTSSIMSQPLVTLASSQTMDEAFLCMRENHVRHLPITEDKKIVGIISVRDFGNYYSDKFSKGRTPIAEFWNNYDALLANNTFTSSVEKLLLATRKNLRDSSKTAQSIDSKDPWSKIAQHAREEGFDDLAEILGLTQCD